MLTKHLLKISLVISLLLHLLILSSYQSISKIKLFPVDKKNISAVPPEIEKRLEFELVETPSDARSEKPPENTNLVSDKNSIARDRYKGKDKPIGAPYSNGDFDVKNLPQQPISLANADNFSTKYEGSNEAQTSSENLSETNYSYEKFSRQQLIKNYQQPTQNQSRNQELEKPNYDNKDFRAKDIGGLTFNTYEWDFAPYMLAMKKRVERNIFPPPAFTHMGLISGETTLRFKVMPNGKIINLEVLKYIGHESLKETSVQAILNSAPFRPLPADFPENYLEVTANFSYYVKR